MDGMMNEALVECETLQVDCATCGELAKAVSHSKLEEQRLRERNLQDLAALQAVVAAEEGEAQSTQQVLSRVLRFYNRYVPFKK